MINNLMDEKRYLKESLEIITNNYNERIEFLNHCYDLENQIRNYNKADCDIYRIVTSVIKRFKKNQKLWTNVNQYDLRYNSMNDAYFKNEAEKQRILKKFEIFGWKYLNFTKTENYKDLLKVLIQALEENPKQDWM